MGWWLVSAIESLGSRIGGLLGGGAKREGILEMYHWKENR